MSGETISLGYEPRQWQRAAHLGLAQKRWGVLVVHRRGGKTVLAIMHLIHRALAFQGKDGRFAYVAPLLKQAKDIAWNKLKEFTQRIPGVVISEAELHVTLPGGSRIRLYGADNPDALRGIYLDGVVLDEVAQLAKDLWDSVLRPALSDRKGWGLFMGTPNGVNLLSDLYFAAKSKPEWFAALYTVYDTKALPDDEVESMKGGGMTSAAFAREYLCDFAVAADDALLSLTDVEGGAKRYVTADMFKYAPKILGVDVARQGDDRSCVFPRQGLFARDPFVWRKIDSMELTAQVCRIDDEYQADAIFVDGSGGYGAGVIDRLRQLGRSVIEVQFGGRADDERFANKRAEMWFRLAEWVKKSGRIPDINELKQDLCAPTYGHNQAGKLILEGKDSMKARGMLSPDLGDALALTFAYPVKAKNDYKLLKPETIVKEYDPMDAYLSEIR